MEGKEVGGDADAGGSTLDTEAGDIARSWLSPLAPAPLPAPTTPLLLLPQKANNPPFFAFLASSASLSLSRSLSLSLFSPSPSTRHPTGTPVSSLTSALARTALSHAVDPFAASRCAMGLARAAGRCRVRRRDSTKNLAVCVCRKGLGGVSGGRGGATRAESVSLVMR